MDRGECSKQHERTSIDGKPLKKARYSWEIKGKHHLKERHKNNNNNDRHINTCCVESFLADTAAFLDSDCDEEHQTLPNTITKHALENSIQDEVPVTLVSNQTTKNRDYYLRKWQARQIARGFIDNTINSVLETWNNPPFDPVDFVDNCEQDGEVEDNAILMAIQSHGLQSGRQFIDKGFLLEQTNIAMEQMDNDVFQCSTSASSSDNSNSISLSSIQEYDDANNDPMDFLNAAVSVAIQEKGLSYT